MCPPTNNTYQKILLVIVYGDNEYYCVNNKKAEEAERDCACWKINVFHKVCYLDPYGDDCIL